MEIRDTHLTEDELFRLAIPAAGEPEALPSHLRGCAECGRRLQAWKAAVRELSEEDDSAIARRTPEEWRALENETLAAIGRSGAPGMRSRRLLWAFGLAASLVLAVLLTTRRPAEEVPAILDDAAELSAQDRADDRLLREVSVLASGEDPGGAWISLAPVPSGDGGAEVEEDRL
jgi:hypothetical protein